MLDTLQPTGNPGALSNQAGRGGDSSGPEAKTAAGRSHPLRAAPSQRASGAGRLRPVATVLADPRRRPVEFARKLGIQATSRPYRLVCGVAVDEPKTPEHTHQVDVRLLTSICRSCLLKQSK